MILLHMLLVLNLPHKASRTVIPLFFLLALLGIGVGAVIVVAVVDLGRIVSALLSHGPEFDLIVPRGFPFRFGIIVQGHDGMNGWKQGAHCRRFRGWRRGCRRGAAKGNSTFTVVLVVVAMVVRSWRWCGSFVGSASSYPPGGGFHQCDGDGRVVLVLAAAAVREGKGVSRQGIGRRRRRGERGHGRSRTRMSALVAATATVGTPRVV